MNKLWLAGAAVAAITAPAAMALANSEYGGNYYGHGMGGGWGHTIFGPLMMVAFIAITVVIVIAIVRWMSPSRGSQNSAVQILEERFARGEIDRAEFDERRRALNG